MDCSPPGPSVHGISQARILKWVAISSSTGSFWPRIKTLSSVSLALAGEVSTTEPPGKPKLGLSDLKNGLRSSWCTYISSEFNSLKENLLPSLMWVCTNDSRAEWRQKVICCHCIPWTSCKHFPHTLEWEYTCQRSILSWLGVNVTRVLTLGFFSCL